MRHFTISVMVVLATLVLCAPGITGINDGLVAYYPFTGNANDMSGNNRDGMVEGATLSVDRFGNTNSAYSFDGIDDLIHIPTGVDVATDAFTISAWVLTETLDNPDDYWYPGLRVLLMTANYEDKGGGQAALNIGNGIYNFNVKSTDGQFYTAWDTEIATTNQFDHLVGVYNRGDKMQLWINGQLINVTCPHYLYQVLS